MAPAPKTAPPGQEIATFGMGCFWSGQLAYQRAPGVTHTTVGYTGGKSPDPTYESVCSGHSGHAEAIQVYYDPKETSYDALLDVFFGRVDPTTLNRQGNDVGTQYRSAIWYHTAEQKALAEQKIKAVQDWLGKKVVTTVEPAQDYFLAEDYHQKYLERGGRNGNAQSGKKGCTDPIRCYG